jgi:hypothetical protein
LYVNEVPTTRVLLVELNKETIERKIRLSCQSPFSGGLSWVGLCWLGSGQVGLGWVRFGLVALHLNTTPKNSFKAFSSYGLTIATDVPTLSIPLTMTIWHIVQWGQSSNKLTFFIDKQDVYRTPKRP